ncbi:unnamed protein product [Lactuca saligna]|uniref:Uncharacterized protein n=1 Tax=Lactuca saligna TaxID=75948 RepID=A0AA35YMS9_LACSI|nr:unnamed protein product [Lactuca saligna]
MAPRGARGGGHCGCQIGGRDAGDRNASQSHNNAESQPSSSSVRGSNILEQVPNQISLIRAIACILKTMFDGPWTSWKKIDKEHHDAMWEHFKQATLKRPPTGVELYARLDTKRSTQEYITPKAAKVKEAYESAMVAKFGDDTSYHLLLDNETWCDVSGGVNKGRIYGFGSVSDPTSFLEGTSSTITSQEVVYERVRNEMRGEMDAKAAEMEAKHQ